MIKSERSIIMGVAEHEPDTRDPNWAGPIAEGELMYAQGILEGLIKMKGPRHWVSIF